MTDFQTFALVVGSGMALGFFVVSFLLKVWPVFGPKAADDPRCYECKFGNGNGSGRYCSRCGSKR